MKSLYISTSGDITLELPVPLEVEGCMCGIIEMSGRLSTYKGDLYLCSDICEESIGRRNSYACFKKYQKES